MTRRLTQAELGIWLGHQRAEDPAVYNAAEGLSLHGPLEANAFERALERTLEEASSLQVRYVERNGEPACVPCQGTRPRLRVVDLSALPEPRRELDRAVAAELRRPFSLERGQPFEHYLYRLEPERHVWVHRAHHVALDGYGFNLIARRLAEHYGAEAGGRPAPPGPFDTAGNVLGEDTAYHESEARQNDRRYWLDELMSVSAPCLGQRARAPAHGARASRVLSNEQQTAFRELARSWGVEWTELAIALVAVLVHEATGARHLSLGLPVMLRFGTSALRVPCMAMNIVPVPVHVEPSATLGSLAQQLRATLARARPHLRYRYEHLNVDPELRRRAFGPVVNLIPFEPPRRFGACSVEPIGFSAGPVEDVAFTFRKRHGALELLSEGHPAEFGVEQLAIMSERLLDVLAAPERPLATAKGLAVGAVEAFFERFLKHVRERPQHVALEEGELRLSYAEVEAAVRGAAAELSAHGVAPGHLVALDLPRSALAWILVLATHWVGAGYAALDPHHPVVRREAILRALEPRLLVRRAGTNAPTPHGVPVLDLGDDALNAWLAAAGGPARPAISARQPAYAVFTSGSTGAPKGVVIERDALDHFVAGALTTYGFAASDRVLQFAALTFDASVEEALVTWSAGATLVLRDDAMLSSMPGFVGSCRERGITVLDLPTAFWHELCLALRERVIVLPPAVRLVIVGGEAVAAERLREWQEHAGKARLLNTYGPSEATIVATCAELTAESPDCPIPIGRPLPFVEALLLDATRREVTRAGVVGELCLLGPTLGRGYLGRDDLTRERFVELPGHGRAYLTGDLAHWDELGRLIFAGRRDDELKISGYRIAPAEVERALATHPRVRASVVHGERSGSGSVHLAAHVEADEAVTSAELRRFLAPLLPAVMIPTVIQLTAALPRTTHGKLDRNALRRASIAVLALATQPTAQSPELELVLSAWREVLGDVALEADDDFFAVGGTSLQVIQLANRLSRRGAAFSVASVFRHPTPRKQAELLQGRGAEEELELEPVSLDLAGFTQPARRDGSIASVLLSGATGFVGAYLLQQLLTATTCHVTVASRARDDLHAAERLAETSERYGFDLSAFASRLRSVAWPARLESLERCDAVLNSAAEVSLTRDYGSLRASNVLLVRDLLALAARWGASFHQVSTVAALPDGTTHETFAKHWSGSRDGYRLSKWQAEGLCAAAGEVGLPVAVYRLGRVAAAEKAPRINGNDIVWRIAAASAHVGGWPDLQVREPWIPVDEAARVIVELMLRGSGATPPRAYHLTHAGYVDIERLRRVLTERGVALPRLSLPDWLARVNQHGSTEHLATAAFLELRGASPERHEPGDWSFDNLREVLPSAHQGEISDGLLRAYAEAALSQGVLVPPR